MTEPLTPAQQQARFLRALAAHLDAHPHLAEVYPYGSGDCWQLRVLPREDESRDDDTVSLIEWARSLDAGALRVMAIPGQDWSSVKFTADVDGHPATVWAPVQGLPPEVTALSVTELAHFAEHATLPETGGGPR